jgi:hypothetical protein
MFQHVQDVRAEHGDLAYAPGGHGRSPIMTALLMTALLMTALLMTALLMAGPAHGRPCS